MCYHGILLGIVNSPSSPPALLTVSRHGQLLRSWDLESGQLKYEVATSLPPPAQRSFPLDQSWRPGGVQATLAGKKGGECTYMYLCMYLYMHFTPHAGVVVVASGSKVTGFVARSGEQKWTFSVRADKYVVCGHVSCGYGPSLVRCVLRMDVRMVCTCCQLEEETW